MDDLDFGATIKGFSPGQRIFNRYALRRILGRGGMGVVWLARDESLEREVAIKLLPEMVAADPAAVRELKRETSRSQQLSHPHILRIYDFAEGAGLCGITMELVEGGTLTARRLEQPGEVFKVAQLGPWVRQLGEALAYAHDKVKIVHRDLKPANLMLTPDGDLKIADFGIAASVNDSISRASRQVGSSGTPVYMSPQQMMGDKPAVTDDIYALGATLYELLTGKPPFHSGNVMMQVQNKVPPAIRARREEFGVTGESIPAAWEQTIAACLAKEPAQRPQSAGEVVERLGLAGGMATKSTTIGAVALNGPEVERLAASAEASREGRAPKALAPTNDYARATSKAPLFAGLTAGLLLLGGFGWYVGIHRPEQQRLAEIKAPEEQGVAAPALKLKTEQELIAANAERQANARGGAAIRTTPAGAEVRVGAVALEKSPLTLKDLKLGKYPVKVSLSGYEDWSGTIEVTENEFADLEVTLIRSTGTLSLSTTPAGLEAELSGRDATAGLPLAPKQTVRTPAELKLPTGTYDVTFRREGWADQTKTVSITRAGTAQADAAFDPGAMTVVTQTAAFFDKLKADPAVRELPSGLRYKITKEGTGAKPAATSKVKVHYKGYLIDGTVVDSSLDRGEPAEFAVQGTIQGFAEGLQQIGNGGKITLYIPPALGYGDTGAAGVPRASVLIFEIELLEVDGKAPMKFNVPGVAERSAAKPAANPLPEVEKLRGAAAAGDAVAMTNLGHAYETGTGVVKDLAAAIGWYRKAAEKGEVTAMKNLGVLYANGRGVAQDQVAAADWYRKAAAKGEAGAMTNLGHAYETGAGVVMDQAAAVDWYRKAAEQGEVTAMKNLGVLYANGRGVPKDLSAANDWYRKAAAKGDPSAMRNLGLSYANGQGVAQDDAAAIEWYRKAVEKGLAEAMTNLGFMYERGRGVPKDLTTAIEWYRKAAEQGEPTAIKNLGVVYANGLGVAQDEAAAIEWYRKAARLGNADARTILTDKGLAW